MKINVARRSDMAERKDADLAMNISVKVAQVLSSLMQVSGVRSLSLAQSDSFGETRLVHASHEFFQEAPAGVVSAIEKCIDPICGLMASFGITGVALEPENDDISTLSEIWLSLFRRNDSGAGEAGEPGDPGEPMKAGDAGMRPASDGAGRKDVMEQAAPPAEAVEPEPLAYDGRRPGVAVGEPGSIKL